MKQQMSKAQEWWLYKSPLFQKQLQIKYFPATNWKYLSKQQIQFIYEQEQEQVLRYSENRC
jgi:hypothetical protein